MSGPDRSGRPSVCLLLALCCLLLASAPTSAADAGRGPPGAVLVVASSDALKDSFLAQTGQMPAYRGSAQLVLNAIESLLDGGRLLDVSLRSPAVRTLREGDDEVEKKLRRGIESTLRGHLERSGLELDDEGRRLLRAVARDGAGEALRRVQGRWPARAPEVRISGGVRATLRELPDLVSIEYHLHDEGGDLAEASHFTREYLTLLAEASGGRVRVREVDPVSRARAVAEKRTREYLERRRDGKSLEEPEAPRDPMDMFRGTPTRVRTPEERRTERERRARQEAARTGVEEETILRGLLLEEFQRAETRRDELEGLRSLVLDDRTGDRVRRSEVTSALRITHLDRAPEVIASVTGVEDLEWQILRAILRLRRTSKPRVLFVDGAAAAAPAAPPSPLHPRPAPVRSEYSAILGHLEETFEVERHSTSKEAGSLPPCDLLLVAQPRDLGGDTVGEIRRRIEAGVPAILLVSTWSLDASQSGAQAGFPLRPIGPSIAFARLLADRGVRLPSDRILTSTDCCQLLVPRMIEAGGMRMMAQQPIPVAAILALRHGALDSTSGILAEIGELALPVTPGLEIDRDRLRDAGLEARVLVRSGERCWSAPMPAEADPTPSLNSRSEDLVQPRAGDGSGESGGGGAFLESPVPLVVLLRSASGGRAD